MGIWEVVSALFSLVVIAIIAAVAPFLFRRAGLPVVVAEILLGLAVGAFNFAYEIAFHYPLLEFDTAEPEGQALVFLAEIGIIYLLFLSGLELDFGTLGELGARGIVLGLGFYGGSLAIAFFFVNLLGLPPLTALIIGAVSVAIPLTTLKSTGLLRSPYGQQALATALIADVATMIGLAIFLAGADPGTLLGLPSIVVLLVAVPLLFALVYAIYRLVNLLVWNYPDTLARFFRGGDPVELEVRASFALMFIFAGAASVFGGEAILGAFLAGAVISLLLRRGAQLERKLAGFGYGFFVPVFFISIGMSFPFDALLSAQSLFLLPLLVVVSIIAKVVPALIFSPQFTERGSARLGFLMVGQLTLAVAGVALAARPQPPLLSAELQAILLLMVIATAFVAPAGFRALRPKGDAPDAGEGDRASTEGPRPAAAAGKRRGGS